MITELIVTSAPRGLQAGRSGFTTVMRTRGIHPDLAIRLEAASGYRHTYPQGDPRNPVVFSYTNTPSAAGDGWVLSRVGDAGTDYTGRSNKIAHHVALKLEDVGRLTISNPALVLAALAGSGGFKTVWQGEPMESPTSPAVPMPPSQPGVCERWRAAAGDPGWAGVLVERALNKETTWVIAPPGTDVLGLFAEALALAGPAQRWQIPFTTYSLNRNEGRWLGTVSGTPEAEAARKQPRVLVIDLVNPGLPPTAGPYVQAARGLAAPPWVKLHSPQERVVAPQSTAETAPIQSTAGTLSGMQMRPEMVPPPIHAQPALPPTLKQWPGSLPEPSRPWYATPAILCAVGGAILTASAFLVYRTINVRPDLADKASGSISIQTNESRGTVTEKAVQKSSSEGFRSHTADSKQANDDARRHPDSSDITQQDSIATEGQNGNPQAKDQGPGVFACISEAAKSHSPMNAMPLYANGLTDDPVTLLKWDKAAAGELSGVTLKLPSLSSDSTAKYVLEWVPPDVSAEHKAPEVQWRCSRESGDKMTVGVFTVSPRKLTFSPSLDGYGHSSGLLLRPLLFLHSQHPEPAAWIDLQQPLRVTAFASSGEAFDSNRLLQIEASEEGNELSAALRPSKIVLHLPDGCVGQSALDGPDVPFRQDVAWDAGPNERRFRWRPTSWNPAEGVWMSGVLEMNTGWENGWVVLRARLQLGQAGSIDLRPKGFIEHRNFKASLGNEAPISFSKFMVVATSALEEVDVVGSADLSPEARLAKRRLLKQQLPDWWGKLADDVDNGDPKTVLDVGIQVGSYASDHKNERAQTANEWIDYLRDYLLAYRVCELTRGRFRPSEDIPVNDADKVKRDAERKAWEEYVAGLKRSLKVRDKDAFHRWCEELAARDNKDPAYVLELARLWMRLSSFAEDVRQDSDSKRVAQAVRARLSGCFTMEWSGPSGAVTSTPIVLEPGPGEFASVSQASQSEESTGAVDETDGERADKSPSSEGDDQALREQNDGAAGEHAEEKDPTPEGSR
jgi:hypothetical protein